MTKLEERRKQYEIPDLPYLPKGDNVLVFRLPSETRTSGGLYIPGSAEEPKPMGVLVAAGLLALDELTDALIVIGDIVWFARFAGWEKEIERDPKGIAKQILQMKAKEVLGTVDGLDRVYGRKAIHIVEFDAETEQHWYVKRSER